MVNWKRLIPSALKELVWKIACDQLHLKTKLRSGVPIKIASFSDWCVYNDLFVEREYDPGIVHALANFHEDSLVVVDLGANVGFFTLRVLHLLAGRVDPPKRIFCLLVEGSPLLCRELKERFAWLQSDSIEIQLVTGLVGQKQGQGQLSIHRSQNTNKVASHDGSSGVMVEYVDLDPLLSRFGRIDLLKCDIEGSEKELIENYPTLLKRTETAMFEFHEPDCSGPDGAAAMQALGFSPLCAPLKLGGNEVWYFKRS